MADKLFFMIFGISLIRSLLPASCLFVAKAFYILWPERIIVLNKSKTA
jgi:hypothetical protein